MKNDIYDVRWSPFDPEWYKDAFDKPINTADMNANIENLVKDGYIIPDADGSKSSVIRSEAVLNNSFNESLLRESLKDIYFNNSHRLVASNHDNTHFFQWAGHMEDMKVIPNTVYCQFSIPCDSFIYPNERDIFKMSQYYRKWIKIEDILNNRDIFKWHCLLFIDKRIYSEYELRIDDREATIRFRYYDFWIKQNYPVYIYKFDTNSSARSLISREQCENVWNWKIPISYLGDQRICNSDRVIVVINRINDPSIRKDGSTNVEVLGDNLEFLPIIDGCIDLSNISDFNRACILSEKKEWLWLSAFVPKFFHEYPIVLPTDVIYQPYEADLRPVATMRYDLVQHVKSKLDHMDQDVHQVYVDMNGELQNKHDSWKRLIRPVVLSDAFDSNYVEPYDRLLDDVNILKQLTVDGADLIEEFRFFVKKYSGDDEFKRYCSDLRKSMDDIRNCMHDFLDKIFAEYDTEYEMLYKRFLVIMDEIDDVGIEHDLFHTVSEYERPDRDFWMLISPLVWIPRGLADNYYVINVIHDMGENKTVWEDRNSYADMVRFQRPVDESDFWTFEYDNDKQVWRPYPLSVSRHFPDVYVMNDGDEEVPTLNRVFKAFFFYSDTMNVTNVASDIIRPTNTWDEDVDNYHINQSAVYRDIFMEKFYWVGMRSIYKGLLVTNNRWEVIEYVIDNKSYDRFNQLFLKTMDPYFKLGLATYLRSPEFGFPFDDAINKMEESINSEFIGYRKITNFEVYLNKTWIPSYFDYITKIVDDWEYKDRLIRRPRSTFDILRLLPIMLAAQDEVFDASRGLMDLIHWILDRLNEESYKLDVNSIAELGDLIDRMYEYISSAYTDTKELDEFIFSIDDINSIADKLKHYLEYQQIISDKFDDIREDIEDNNVHEIKKDLVDEVQGRVDTVHDHIMEISSIVNDFDFGNFMSVLNELKTYFDHNKDNPDDNSLLGHINQFNDVWTEWVKIKRTNLFLVSNELFGFWDSDKLYEDEDVEKMINLVDDINARLIDLKETIDQFYQGFGYEQDELLYNKFDRSAHLLSTLNNILGEFLEARSRLVDEYERVLEILDKMGTYPNETEIEFMEGIKKSFHDIIRHLSYIAGQGNKEDANESLRELNEYIARWYGYLNTEKEVFDHLLTLADPPIEIIGILDKHRDIITAIVEYMDTVNIKYLPDSEWPTYSDVYRVRDVEIVTSGFKHNAGEFVYASNLGTYRVEDVDGFDDHLESLSDTLYRNTTFRNPMVQYRPYDTITDGIGMGISLKPLEIEHKVIINDSVVGDVIERMGSISRMISKNIKTYNPSSNSDTTYIVGNINEISESWDKLIDKFWDHMTPAVKLHVNALVKYLCSFIDPCKLFSDTRGRITLGEFIKLYQDYIYDSFNYTREIDKQDETFFYYDAIIRQSYDEVINFYGTGTSWSDGQSLKKILSETSRIIKFFWKKIFDDMDESDQVIHIKELRDSLVAMINDIVTAIEEIPTQVIDINGMITRLNEGFDKTPEFHKDIWYRFKDTSIAIDGMEYRIGDIVEIVLTDEDVANMVPLTVSELKAIWNPGVYPDNFDRDEYNPTGVRQLNPEEINTIWNGGEIDEDNPGDQYIKLVAMKPIEIYKIWNGEYVPEEVEDVTIDSGLDDVILLQITDVDEYGRVKSVKSFMDYAIPFKISGVKETRSRVGKGYGLKINCDTIEVDTSDSTLLDDDSSAIATHPKFDENDLMMFKFENIHDLYINYEVFVGGRQISDFIVRHDNVTGRLHPNKIDAVYINANAVMDLQNSSIRIPAEHYFIYKIDDITIRDPGTGYCVDQNIYVGTDSHALRMKVSELKYGPLKGISIPALSDNGLLYAKNDPAKENAEVVTDSMNNIDDEFNVGYYDKLTDIGFEKPLTKSFDPKIYSYAVKRFDDLKQDDRNATFIYPDVDIKDGYPQNGDPDNHWYQGSRIDISDDTRLWNGISNVVPPTDPFIPDSHRIPAGQPVKGEYQMIESMKIHNTDDSTEYVDMTPLTVEEVTDLYVEDKYPDNFDRDEYNPTGVRQLNPEEINTIWNGGEIDEDNPGNQKMRLKIISPMELFMIWNGQEIEDDGDDTIWGDGIVTDVTSAFNFRVESLQNACMIDGDLVVDHFSDLPRHKEDYPDGCIGKCIIVEHDETNYGHRMMYRIRTFIAAGFFVYDLPEIADRSWNEFNINWMESDWIADFPTYMAQCPEAPWETAPTYRKVMHQITDGKVVDTFVPSLTNNSSFIANLTVDDISVYNWSTHEWEDLHDDTRWELTVRNDEENHDWGFTLRFLQNGSYSYDMRLYLNKTPYTQQKNAELKRNATMDVTTIIHSEVNQPATNVSVNTGRELVIRKLFPYRQKESFKIGFNPDGSSIGYKMNFKVAPYMHFRNQLHLEDVMIYNKSAGRFENILDPKMFEVQFKDPRAVSRGYEINTRVSQVIIGNAGKSFISGTAWAWNPANKIIVFGIVTADYNTDGHLITFTATHCPNPPKENISMEFEVFQNDNQSNAQKAVVIIEFVTEKVEMYGDGYIHKVTNPLAPLPDEFRVIALYDLDGIGEYDIIIDNTPKSWTFVEPNWLMMPTFHIEGTQITGDKLYVLTDKGRLPMINPSTRRPTLNVTQTENGTDVTFMNVYKGFSKMDLRSVPYPMRSVYVQRNIPKSGYIDLGGKINKPLNKKYFEFWVNGKLLQDEVTIISPTRLFLHGLRSLKNLEIIEVNRDPNEYFSDSFLEVVDEESRPYYNWNYKTYLDDALDGRLASDNYSEEEQKYLLAPVWPQVSEDDPEYKNFPPNVDIEDDILLIVGSNDIGTLDNPLYQFMVIDPPTLEGKAIFEQGLSLDHFGLTPISDEMIVDMLNDEWSEELETNPYLKEHFIISDDEWYGTAARLYDEYGIRVHTLNESAYNVHTDKILRINSKTKSNKIVTRQVVYDLT